jgi:hypothetical protein
MDGSNCHPNGFKNHKYNDIVKIDLHFMSKHCGDEIESDTAELN